MSRDEIYVHVAAAMFAAYRTDARPSDVKKDVLRTLQDIDPMVDAIEATLRDKGESKTRLQRIREALKL